MGFLRWVFAALLGTGLLATAAVAGPYVPTANVAALAAYGANSPLIAHATVYDAAQNVSYDWYASCPGSPDGSQYVAATGVATGCWVRLSLPPAIVTPPGTSGQFLLNNAGAFDAKTLTCADISDSGSGCSGSLASYLALAGGTMTGELVTAASGTGGAGFNLPPGAAPTSPVNGDVWTTSLGMYAQINGATVGPFGTGGGGGGTPGGLTTQVQYNNAGTFGGITGATTNGTTMTLASPVFSGTVSGAGTVPNSVLVNSSMTIAGHSIALGGTQAIACGDLSNGAASCSTDTTNAANISSGTLPALRLSGSYTGITGVGALTAGSIGVGFTAIGNSSLANSSMTIAGHSVALGGTQAIACGDLSNGGALCPLNTLPLTDLDTQAADTLVMNASGLLAAPTAVAMPTTGTNGCAGTTNALTYNTTTHALGCNTITGGGSGCIPSGSLGEMLYDNGSGACLDTTGLTTDGTNVTSSIFSNSAIKVLGTSTGKTTIASANAGASNFTLTLPAATDTLVGKATSDVFTNKTYDTAGTGNSFSINGVAVTANTGTGAMVRASSPTIASPTFSGTVAGAGTIPNGVLVNSSMTIAGHSISLGGTQAIACGDLSNSQNSCSIIASTTPTASQIAERDSNANLFANNILSNATLTVGTGGTTTLTAGSSKYQALSTAAQTYVLPDATTLSLGPWFTFNDNSSGALTINKNGGASLFTVPAGGVTQCGPTDISTAAGLWDCHSYLPSTVSWGTGVTGLQMNNVLTTSPQIGAGASSCTAPSFIPQRGASTTGFGGAGTNVCGAVGGATTFTSTTTAFNIPSGATYQVNGTQIAASNLSNGTTGSGAVVLATSPSLTTPNLGAASATSLAASGLVQGAQVYQVTPNQVVGSPLNPTGVTSTTPKMMGLGTTVHLAPTFSGRFRITVTGFVTATSAESFVQIYYGTGTAPTNGAAATGTATGNQAVLLVPAAGGTFIMPFTLIEQVTGLTLSTSYWFDLGINSTASSMSVGNIRYEVTEY